MSDDNYQFLKLIDCSQEPMLEMAQRRGMPLVSYDFNDHRRGLVKSAASELFSRKKLESLRPPDTHFGIHHVVMGSQEMYGGNRNGDAFPNETLKSSHPTFVTNGHVYREHRHTKNDPKIGIIKLAAHCPDLQRTELYLWVDKKAAAKEYEEAKAGKHHAFSMSAAMPHDWCLTADMLINTSEGYVSAEQIFKSKRRFQVLSHRGVWCEVKARLARQVSQYVSIGVHGDCEAINATEEHPFWVVPRETFLAGKTIRRSAFKGASVEPVWRRVDELRLGDYLVFQKTAKSEDVLTTAEARVLGYYLAEGCPIWEKTARRARKGKSVTGLSFSFGNTESELRLAHDLMQQLRSIGMTASLQPDKKRQAVAVKAYGRFAAEKLVKLGGCGSSAKSIHPSVFGCSDELILQVLSTAFNGDGSQDATREHARYKTVSRELARSIRRLALEVGIPASIACNKFSSPWAAEDSEYYSVFVPASQVYRLSGKGSKLQTSSKPRASRAFTVGDKVCIPITSLTVVEADVPVYNVSVAEDESYQVLDYVSHNCSICNNMAKSAKDYCVHLSDHMTEYLTEFKKYAFAINKIARFFDDSFVKRQADRIAYGLQLILPEGEEMSKFASQARERGVVPGGVLAQIEGIYVPEEFLRDRIKLSALLEKHRPLLVKLASAETLLEQGWRGGEAPAACKHVLPYAFQDRTQLSKDEIFKLSHLNPGTMFRGLAERQTWLTLPEFAGYIYDKSAEDAASMDVVKEAMSLLPELFRSLLGGRLAETEVPVGAGNMFGACGEIAADVDTAGTDEIQKMMDVAAARHGCKSAAHRALARVVKNAGARNLNENPTKPENISEEGRRFAGFYALYKMAAFNDMISLCGADAPSPEYCAASQYPFFID